MVAERGCRWLEFGEDQVSTDISNVVQATESDMMARGVALDLLKVAFSVGVVVQGLTVRVGGTNGEARP